MESVIQALSKLRNKPDKLAEYYSSNKAFLRNMYAIELMLLYFLLQEAKEGGTKGLIKDEWIQKLEGLIFSKKKHVHKVFDSHIPQNAELFEEVKASIAEMFKDKGYPYFANKLKQK